MDIAAYEPGKQAANKSHTDLAVCHLVVENIVELLVLSLTDLHILSYDSAYLHCLWALSTKLPHHILQ